MCSRQHAHDPSPLFQAAHIECRDKDCGGFGISVCQGSGTPLPPPMPRGSCASGTSLPHTAPALQASGSRSTQQHRAASVHPCHLPRAHLIILSSNFTPRERLIYVTNCWLICNWIMETEARNWNGIGRTWSRKLLSNKHGKPEKMPQP